MTLDVAIVFIINVIFNPEIADKNQQCAAFYCNVSLKFKEIIEKMLFKCSDASRVG